MALRKLPFHSGHSDTDKPLHYREERAQAKGAGVREVSPGFLGKASELVLKDQKKPTRRKGAVAGFLWHPLLSLKHS